MIVSYALALIVLSQADGASAELRLVMLLEKGGSLKTLDLAFVPEKQGTIGKLDSAFRVRQVTSKTSALVDFGGEQWYLLKGIDASALVDDKSYPGKGMVLAIAGTEAYQTAIGGRRTVQIAERINVEQAVAARLLELRTHSFSSVGVVEFVKLENGIVHAKRANGSTVAIPGSDVTDDDRAWMRTSIAKQKALTTALKTIARSR